MASEKRMINIEYLEPYAVDIFGAKFIPYAALRDVATVDAVEVVRCGECLSHDDESCPTGRVWCKTMCRYMEKDGFCSFGKRCQDA